MTPSHPFTRPPQPEALRRHVHGKLLPIGGKLGWFDKLRRRCTT